jgi:hypothetical protein
MIPARARRERQQHGEIEDMTRDNREERRWTRGRRHHHRELRDDEDE